MTDNEKLLRIGTHEELKRIEELRAWYYGTPSPIKVKWKEIIPENKEEMDNR